MKSLRNCLYIPFLFLLLLSFIPQSTDAQRRRSRKKVASDSLVLDSLSLKRDSLLQDSLALDSLNNLPIEKLDSEVENWF